MHYCLDGYLIRRPELSDLEQLYQYKNDVEITSLLGGFSTGYSRTDLTEWIEFHRKRKDEALWAIVDAASEHCIGHVGLYHIDHRIRTAEFAIMIGDRSYWGKGIGRSCTKFAVQYGFSELNLNRISLSAMASNERATGLYQSLGFKLEGRLRQAQYKGSRYVDVILMSLLREEYQPDEH